MADNDTEITLLHIIQLPYFIDPNGFTYYDVKSDEIRKTTEDALEQKLKAIRSLYPEYNIVYKIELDNDPAEFIVNTQKKDGFDLIVMGTHVERVWDDCSWAVLLSRFCEVQHVQF